MKIFERKNKKNICKCGNPLPENYKYDKCTTCRRKNANVKKGLFGGGVGLLGFFLAMFFRKK